MTSAPVPWDVEGPVQAEVFVLWLDDGRLSLSGPCGADAWRIELGSVEHPVAVVDRIVRDVLGEPLLVHSTSWRQEREAVILTFVVAVDAALVAGMPSAPVARAELARSGATAAPAAIASEQVIEHAVRHLAWLAAEDPVVSDALPPAWSIALRDHVPEPFRNLG